MNFGGLLPSGPVQAVSEPISAGVGGGGVGQSDPSSSVDYQLACQRGRRAGEQLARQSWTWGHTALFVGAGVLAVIGLSSLPELVRVGLEYDRDRRNRGRQL